jgi:DNA-binding MarR family transcriptional regulator
VGVDSLDHLIWHIGRAYYAYIGRLELILAETGLDRDVRPGMGPVLFCLFEEDGRSIKDIAARTQLSCSTLTGLLERMEAAGLLRRCRDEKDGRVVRVRLTARGRGIEPRCREVVQTFDQILQAGLGETRICQTKRLLRRFIEAMRAETPRASSLAK